MSIQHKKWWQISACFSGLMLIGLIVLWWVMNLYDPLEVADDRSLDEEAGSHSEQLASESDVNDYFAQVAPLADVRIDEAFKVKTGVFIQSFEFFNSSEVNLSGYIWQKYDKVLHDEIMLDEGEVGFILPEQVNSGSDIEPRLVYQHDLGDEELFGWYFEATLKQPFEYIAYPFDHKTVWVKLWSNNFSENVILVPDFDSYDETGIEDIFGIENSIVMGGWEREDTFFNYRLSSYKTDFGIPDYVGKKNFPELHFNFVIKRSFGNAFLVYLLPLFLVASLLFASLLTISADHELKEQHDFNTNAFIAASSALFFVVMLSHIQLREQFPGSSIVYLEYFYILMYLFLILGTANTYLFSMKAAKWLAFIHYEDNVIVKVAFWPMLLFCMLVITVLVILFG